MKKSTLKNPNSIGVSLGLPKFSVKTIFLLFTILLFIVQLIYGYEYYHLVDEVFHLYSSATNGSFKIINLSFLSEGYVALHESQPNLFRDKKALNGLAYLSKKLPVITLYAFFLLVIINYFTVPDFELLKFLLIGIHHILFHFILHFFQHQKHCKWYKLFSTK